MVRTAGSCVVRPGKVRQGTQLFEFCSTLRSYKWVQSFSTLEDIEDMKRELSAWSFDWEEIGARLNDDTGSGYVVSKYIGKLCGMWVDNLRWNSCSHWSGIGSEDGEMRWPSPKNQGGELVTRLKLSTQSLTSFVKQDGSQDVCCVDEKAG